MTTRTGMANLIARLQALLNSDTSITATVAQQLLDDRAVFFDAALQPRGTFYLQFVAPYENLEEGSATLIYYGYNTLLTETTDYTVDYQRGVVTTPAADRRGLKILSTAYDLYGAAADGWQRLATASVATPVKITTGGDTVDFGSSGARGQALDMAAHYRALSWPRTQHTERDDTAIDPRWPSNWHGARHYKAGYTP